MLANLQNILSENNRYRNKTINAEQLSAENFEMWKKAVKFLHREAYKVYEKCENDNLQAEDKTVDKTGIFNAFREILDLIGDVKEHKLYANETLAILCVGYAGRRANEDAPALQLCNTKLSNANKELKAALKINGVSAEHLTEIRTRIETLEAERAELLDTPDMSHKVPTMTNASAFRGEIERRFARLIDEQMAKTLEQLDAEKAERDAKRKAAAKARKAKKAAAQAQATTETANA